METALSRPVTAGREAEDVYALAKGTLIGFRAELSDRNIEFICDQISRKVVAYARPAPAVSPQDGRAAVIEECAKVADHFAAYEQTVIDSALANDPRGRNSITAAAGSRKVAAEQIAYDIRALALPRAEREVGKS
jgi:hypothetical protein